MQYSNENKIKYLVKTIAGYPGLNFSEANYSAYLEAFEGKRDQDFIQALNDAVKESVPYFPPLPVVMKCFQANEVRKIKEEKQKLLQNSQEWKRPNAYAQERKQSGWLFKLFKDKQLEIRRAKQLLSND